MLRILFFLGLFVIQGQCIYSQESADIIWWNPSKQNANVIEGQAWYNEVESKFDRLPKRAENKVRKALWDLSRQSTGLLIRFRSNSTTINVRYKVKGGHAFQHMPATGVSGVDLYAKHSDGESMWCRGDRFFGDTIQYQFKNLKPNDEYHKRGREYELYLPLYNSVEWLEIGIPRGYLFEVIPKRIEKPIVVYGTSITQGACASRPGMAWTSILKRKMDRPLINLGFSGNGRLEEALIDLITEIDAKIYILDCLPNLWTNENRTLEDVHQRILMSVRKLRAKRAKTPILLTEHAGYSDGTTNIKRDKAYKELNELLQKTFKALKEEGIDDIYLLKSNHIGLNIESFVDGTHPTDLGMMQYANAYENKLREILKEPVGNSSTTKPKIQSREFTHYSWEQRHRNILKLNKEKPPSICFFGNSITHFWGGEPKAFKSVGKESWNQYFEDLNIRNLGFGWDRIENALWRVYHGELDGFEAKQVVVMLGTNNLHLNTNKEIIEGLELLIKAIKSRQPKTEVLLVGVLPRRGKEERIKQLNLRMASLSKALKINYTNIGIALLKENYIDETLFSDGLHPNNKGYNILAPVLLKDLKK